MLTIYVIAHYFARRNTPESSRNTQPEIRLVNKRIFKLKINFFIYIIQRLD